MSADVLTVSPETLVEEAAQVMLENEIGSVVVVDEDGYLEGILTTTDFVQIVAERQPKDRTPVSEYMTTDIVTADPQDEIQDIADTMLEHGFHHMPVLTAEEEVIGIITTTDLTGYLSHAKTPSPK
jgi:CBS domain-containing protein